MSPKREEDPRIVFPYDLGQELLRIAQEREHPESKLSPLLRALAREWIEKGSYRRREEELVEIADRLSAVEDQLRALTEALIVSSPSSVAAQPKTMTSALDNLARRLLDHLIEIADDLGVTPQVTGKMIATRIGRPGDHPTVKEVMDRIDKLLALGMITVKQDSGGRGGRRYEIEGPGLEAQ